MLNSNIQLSRCPNCGAALPQSLTDRMDEHIIKCPYCGYTIVNESEKKFLKDARYVSACLHAFDYQSSLTYLTEMQKIHPDDWHIQAAYLEGLTANGTNLLEDLNDSRLSEAAKHYRILKYMKGGIPRYEEYGEQRKTVIEKTVSEKLQTLYPETALLLTSIFLHFVLCRISGWFFLGLLASVIILIFVKPFQEIGSARAIARKLKGTDPREDPFFSFYNNMDN